jgi:hypothetical protein
MLLKKGPLTANLDIHIHYVLVPLGYSTSVVRTLELTIGIPFLLQLLKPIILSGLRKENVRILASLKRCVEAKSAGSSAA